MVHAAFEFAIREPETTLAWNRISNYIVLLSVEDEYELQRWNDWLGKFVKITPFYEPDLGNEMTAIAIEPDPKVEGLVSNLALALTQSN